MTIIKMSKAARQQATEKNSRGPANSVQASTARKGKEKVPAGRKAEVVKGLGLDLVGALKAEQETVQDALRAIAQANKPSMLQALEEVKQCRDTERKAAQANDSIIGKKKGRSIDANYQRPITVIKAFIDGFNVDRILAQPSLSLMYAFASRGKGEAKAAGKAQLRGSGFSTWDSKTSRICTKADDAEALARLEKHFMHTLSILAKFEQVTAVPVKAILGLTSKGRSSLRRVA